MPYTLLQAGSVLRTVGTGGGLSDALALPSGIVLATNRTPRFARFKQYTIVVNTPSRPLQVDTSGAVFPLTPLAPATPVSLTATGSGSLTGAYLALQTYVIVDTLGNVIAESGFGPNMAAAVSTSAQELAAAWAASGESLVTRNRLYRTTAGGAVYFPWLEEPAATITITDGTIDAGLGTLAAAPLGPAPDLTLIAEWAGRLWGVDRSDVDDLRYTEAGEAYAWGPLNTLPIPHIGSDAAGITALIPRRNALGVPRLNVFQQVTGDQLSNFKPVVVNGGEQLGCLSQESVVVFNDIAYFLWRDGVYKWDSSGIASVSNGLVRTWFTSDLYFNRAMFWRAFAELDPIRLKYRLFLASLGSTVLDRWIELDLSTGAWFGPHKTDAFTPTCALLVAGADQQPYCMIGSQEGYLSQDQDDRNDWDVSPIAFHVETKSHNMEPDSDKYWGELSVMGKAQPAGTVTITPSVGELDNTPSQAPFSFDMTQGRQRLGRLGLGKQASLVFENDVLDQDVALFGYEINPVNVVGRR